jgi:hypothetical protein
MPGTYASTAKTNDVVTFKDGALSVSFGKNHPFSSGISMELLPETVITRILTSDTPIETAKEYFSTTNNPASASTTQNLYISKDLTNETILNDIEARINNELSTGDKCVIVATYQDASNNSAYERSINPVIVSHTGATVQKASSVDASSNAFIDSKLRITFTDPYLTDPTFTGPNANSGTTDFTGTFDNTDGNRYTATRNDNSFKALGDDNGIKVGPYTTWNQLNTGSTINPYGPFFVNADVSLESSGKPIYTEFVDPSKNVLNMGYDVDLIAETDPVFGRYALINTVNDTVEVYDSATRIDTEISFNMENYSPYLKLLSESDADGLDVNLPTNSETDFLQRSINVSTPGNPYTILDYVDPEEQLYSGFELTISSSATTSALSLVDNSNVTPATIDSTAMIFDPLNMKKLSEAYDSSNNKLTNIDGSNENYFKVKNGTTTLTGSNSENSSMALSTGAEYLTESEWANGSIVVQQTNVETDFSANSLYRAQVDTEDYNGAGLTTYDNLGVRYYTTDSIPPCAASSYPPSSIMDGDLRTINDVKIQITTLFPPTSFANITNYYTLFNNTHVNNLNDNGAIAFVNDPSNVSITPSDISFNTTGSFINDLSDNKLHIIDYNCARTWEANNLYDSGVAVDNIAFDLTGTNTNISNLKDLQLLFTQKSLTDITESVTNSWSLSVPTGEKLITSNEFQSVLNDSDITTILGSDGSHNLYIEFTYDTSSTAAENYTEFHGQMNFSYGENTQITYDDELSYDVSDNLTDISYAVVTGYEIPSGTQLRLYTEKRSFKVSTLFRFGNYKNITIKTPLLERTLTYYALYRDTQQLPRYRLAGLGLQNATISITSGSTTSTYSFYKNDLKPYYVQLQNNTSANGSFANFGDQFSVDMWYNTTTDISTTGYADMTLNINVTSLNYTLDRATMTGDLSLKEGTDTFSVNSGSFDASNIDFAFNPATQTISGNSLELDIPTYDLSGVGINTPGTATLSGNGFTFTYNQNILANFRIVVVKSTIVEVSQYRDSSLNDIHTAFAQFGNELIELYNGIYIHSNVSVTNIGDYAAWRLLNATVNVNFYTGSDVNDTNITYIPYDISSNTYVNSNAKSRYVTFNWYRGYVEDTTTIVRTNTEAQFYMSGYNTAYDMYYDASHNTHGGLITTDQISMYDASFSSSSYDESWNIQIDTEGSYTVTTQRSANDISYNFTFDSHEYVIYDGTGVNIITNSLNTTAINYKMKYNGPYMTVYYNSDYTNTTNALDGEGDINSGWSRVNDQTVTFEAIDLQTPVTNNIIGNILNIHTTNSVSPQALEAYFSICPPFLNFTVVDPSGVSSNPLSKTPSDFYTEVDLSSIYYNPFSSSSSINDIEFQDNAPRNYYYQYLNSNSGYQNMTITPNNIKVELAYGLNDASYNHQAENDPSFNDPSFNAYKTYYDGIVEYVDNSNIQISAIDLSTGTFKISLKQSYLTGLNFIPTDIDIDLSDTQPWNDYNLIANIGNAFITNSQVIDLDYYAGEKINFETWVSTEPESDGTNLSVRIEKYHSTSERNLSAQLHSSVLFAYYQNLEHNRKTTYLKTVNIPSRKVTFKKTITEHIKNELDLEGRENLELVEDLTWTETTTSQLSNILSLQGLTIPATIRLTQTLTVNENIRQKWLVLDLPDFLVGVDKSNNPLVRLRRGTIAARAIALTEITDPGFHHLLSPN